ncbi:hypothetical protein UY3_15295 [Chelonia mydas]|uniref:Uncharacterized protein n=1 Tax=Chelonia mydas TaxID=8469 RepID=M7BH85_CHEMY|nr:hypothetical protein UY3_15295 [Chelonia mydas]
MKFLDLCMRAKCKQCNKEMQGLVAQMKHHEKCFVSGGSCVENDERNTSEHAASSAFSVTTLAVTSSGTTMPVAIKSAFKSNGFVMETVMM